MLKSNDELNEQEGKKNKKTKTLEKIIKMHNIKKNFLKQL